MEDVKEKMSVRQSGRTTEKGKMYGRVREKSRFQDDYRLSVTGF